MTIAFQFIIALLICTLVPILIGDMFFPRIALGKQYISGFLFTLAIAQLLFLPFIVFQRHFTPYFVVYVLIIGCLCIISIVKRHSEYFARIRLLQNYIELIGPINIWMIFAIILIGVQVIRVAVGHFFVYADNAYYIPVINDIVETDLDFFLEYSSGAPGSKETDIKYLFTSYFPYLASISKLSGLHPAILVQTLLPITLTITMYSLVWHYGLVLFKEKKSAWMLVFFFGVLVETIGGYDFTFANHAVAGIYFGKKVVFTILIPYIMLFVVERTSLLSDSVTPLNKKDLLRLFVMILGICAPSLMGTGLAPMLLFAMGLVLTIKSKSVIPFIQMVIAMIPAIVILLMVIVHLYFRV